MKHFIFLIAILFSTYCGIAQVEKNNKAVKPTTNKEKLSLDSSHKAKAKLTSQKKPIKEENTVHLKDPFTPGSPDDEPRDPFDTSKGKKIVQLKGNENTDVDTKKIDSLNPIKNPAAKGTDVAMEERKKQPTKRKRPNRKVEATETKSKEYKKPD